MRPRQKVWFAVLAVLLVSATRGVVGQDSGTARNSEQTVFYGEPDSGKMLVQRPAEMPDSALEALRDTLTGGTFNCLKSMGTTPEQAPASWFIASAIHLNGPNETDLVVQANTPSIATPTNPGGCLLPAHGGRFWVLGPGIASGRYELLLETYGLGLTVLTSRSNRYRDIEVGEGNTALLYKSTGHQYQLAERKTAGGRRQK